VACCVFGVNWCRKDHITSEFTTKVNRETNGGLAKTTGFVIFTPDEFIAVIADWGRLGNTVKIV